jgi:regulation of enolase protein 1 (concanavalin A-like superfamily)
MKRFSKIILLLALLLGSARCMFGGEILFQDQFKNKLAPGWSWIREHRDAWRITEPGLEVLIEPGNMWGAQNDAKNMLVRSVPFDSKAGIEISVQVENKPSHQYEQVDLVWYYNDSNMIKVGEELVDGKLSLVMGREENDKTRTISITPLDSTTVGLRIIAKGNLVRGQFQTSNSSGWRDVGFCDMPAPERIQPRISLQFYQGSEKEPHWAKVTDFRVSTVDK